MELLTSLGPWIVVLILAIIFRPDIKRLVNWIVSFKKVSSKNISLEGRSETKVQDISDTTDIKKLSETTNQINFEKDDEERNHFSLYANKKYNESLQVLDEKIKTEKNEQKLLDLRNFRGHVLFHLKKEEAIEYFESLIKKFPNNYNSYDWYALSFYFNGFYKESIEVLDRGILVVEDKVILITIKANCLTSMGDIEGTKEILKKSISEKTHSPIQYERLCVLLDNEPSTAYKFYQMGLKNFPSSNDLRKSFADFLDKHNKHGEALFHYKELTNKNPDSPYYITYLGNSYLSNNLNDKALENYKLANSKAEEKESWIIANIGNIFKNQGFYTEAISFLEKAINLKSDSEYSHDRLATALRLKKEEEEKENEILKKAKTQTEF